MSVINAIRNKLIHRIFAIVKRQTPYQRDYQPVFIKINQHKNPKKIKKTTWFCHRNQRQRNKKVQVHNAKPWLHP